MAERSWWHASITPRDGVTEQPGWPGHAHGRGRLAPFLVCTGCGWFHPPRHRERGAFTPTHGIARSGSLLGEAGTAGQFRHHARTRRPAMANHPRTRSLKLAAAAAMVALAAG